MKKIILSISVLLALMNTGIAKPVPTEKAKAVALSFLGASSLSRGENLELDLLYPQQAKIIQGEETPYFIFANLKGEGFVIISGDDAIEPVLGYSYENSIDINNLPIGVKELLEAYKNKVSAVQANHIEPTTSVVNAWESAGRGASAVAAVYPVVAPLVKTRWNQGSPFNEDCPGGSLTGCVATAMGQIMYYWTYPTKGKGSHSYKPDNYPTQTANFGSTTYDWSNMRTIYNAASTQKQKDAVALLLYHCGVSVDMDYSTTGSGASTAETADSYVDYFRYLNTTKYDKSSNFTSTEWVKLLKGELDNFRPIQMRGDNHSWVCDGYDSGNSFHMNWGWGGSSDGYFQLADVTFPNLAVVKGIEKPSRIAVSAITSSVSTVCKTQTFTCSVQNDSKFITYLWTVPKGWSVSGVVSTNGEAISQSNSVTIGTPANYNPTGGSVTISVSGLASSGERTLNKSIKIFTGTTPTFTYTPYLDHGLSEHLFTASPTNAIIQYSTNGTSWTSAGNSFTVYVSFPAQKTIYIRANACKASSSKKYVLKSLVDIDNKITALNEEQENDFTFDVFPNPASDHISIQSNKKIKSITCVNYLGQTVPVTMEQNTILISGLIQGIYMLNVINEEGETLIKKFVKE